MPKNSHFCHSLRTSTIYATLFLYPYKLFILLELLSAAHGLGLGTRLQIQPSFASFYLFKCRYSIINTEDLTKPLISRRIKFRKIKKNNFQVEIGIVILQISGLGLESLALPFSPRYLLLYFTKMYLSYL